MGRERDSRRRRRSPGIAEPGSDRATPTVDTIASATETNDAAQVELGVGRVRWPSRLGRHRPRCRPRRAVGSPRSQRCRQDDVVQRRGRRHPADLRLGLDQGRRQHVAALASPTEPRGRPHLPANAPVPRPHGRGQPVPRRRRQARSPSIAAANVDRRAVADQGSRRSSGRVARRPPRVDRRRPLPR